MPEWYSFIVGETNRQQLDNWVTLLSQINVKIVQMGNSETNDYFELHKNGSQEPPYLADESNFAGDHSRQV